MDALKKIFSLKLVVIIISMLLLNTVALSQANYLYNRITVSFTDIPLEKALEQISEKGGFTFSYNSKHFNEQELVSLNVQDKTIARTLNQLFDNSVRYKVVGSHVILNKKNPPEITTTDRPNEYILTGYVIDSKTGQKIREATVYEVDGRVVSLSNSEGFYSLIFPAEKDVYGLSYSKNGYLDTVIMVEPAYKKNIDIYLNPEAFPLQKMESVHIKLEDVNNRQLVDIFVPEESKIISDNLIVHDSRKIQVSLVPYIGTNRKISGSVDNAISLNVLAGYSGGVNGFEVGGLLNIVRRDVNGSQIAGMVNLVGGNTNPFQLAGMFNLNGGSVTGTQIAGMSNVVLDTLNGVQIAGFNNTLHGYMNGVQISGFNNITTQNADGVQLTGFANVALKDVKLGQISGFANYCQNVDGGQLTGFANVATGNVNWGQFAGFANYGNSVKGIQAAGFANISQNEVTGGQLAGFANYGKTGGEFQLAGFGNIALEEMTGVQLAGYFNYAKKVNGYQIAIFNVTDTVESGLPIGIFSYVNKGFHRFEVSVSEGFVNTIYKSGLKKFYNSVRMGYGYTKFVYAGYGIGTQANIGKRMNLNFDLSSDFIFDVSNSFNYAGNINKLTPSVDFNLGKHFSLYVGPSLNVSNVSSNNSSFTNLAPYSFYNETFSNTQIKMWVGGVLGASFTL
ncbi:hypothetical protein ACFLSE_07620 [Bacteroidota bacterium]